jgi:Ca2+-binding EF-hand superfamily protein
MLELTPNPWELISKASLLRFLDSKAGGQYDRYIFEQLYERMTKNAQGYVTVNDFTDVLA